MKRHISDRRLDLHVSALNDVEYDAYTSSLADITLSDDDDNQKHDGNYFAQKTVGVREARAWLRGRYSSVPASSIDEILRFFSPTLAQTDTLSGGEFFAALRLVVHVQSGKPVDRALAFVQAHPLAQFTSRPSSPAKPAAPPPGEGSIPVTLSSSPNQEGDNPFRHGSKPAPPPKSNNPFVSRSKSLNGGPSSKIPPLPPRKPPPPIPEYGNNVLPPPRHASLLFSSTSSVAPSMNTSKSAPNLHRPKSPSLSAPAPPLPKTAHVTSTLMKQSLQVSKTAHTLKKAEGQLEKERIMQVLKSSNPSAPRNRSTSPHKTSSATTTSGSDDAPPLPQRKPKRTSPPISTSSFEQVAYAGSSRRGMSPEITTSTHSSPSRNIVDLPNGPPPKHPDSHKVPSISNHRRAPSLSQIPNRFAAETFDSVYGTPATASPYQAGFEKPESPTTRASLGRSKSMHQASPPTTPTTRKRPESIQVLNSSPFFDREQEGAFRRRISNATTASETSSSSLSNFHRTLATFQPKIDALQPKFDKARYKAEAGISRRGFVRDGISHGMEGEEEEGLMEEDNYSVFADEYAVVDDDVDNQEKDNLKWPAGEGWKPL